MKVSCIALLVGLAAEAQAQSEYDQIRTLVDRVEENESAFVVAYAEKEAEVASLVDQLAACQAGEDSSFSSPSPSATLEPESEAPVLDPTPEEGTASAFSNSGSELSASLSSTWTPRVGDSWNYNLDPPVDTNVDVDVIFIDMGELQRTVRCHCVPRNLLIVSRYTAAPRPRHRRYTMCTCPYRKHLCFFLLSRIFRCLRWRSGYD